MKRNSEWNMLKILNILFYIHAIFTLIAFWQASICICVVGLQNWVNLSASVVL